MSPVRLTAMPSVGVHTVDLDRDITFIAPTLGAQLRDLVRVVVWLRVQERPLQANGSGTVRAESGFPEGTPTHYHVVQNGLSQTALRGATADGFSAERDMFVPVGH